MQIAEEVVNSRPRKKGSKAKKRKLDAYKIPFKFLKRTVSMSSSSSTLKKQKIALSKAKWVGSLGMAPIVIEKRPGE